MKRILIIHFNMELGGAESSLLGLLDTIDYSKYAVDLFLLSHSGEFMPLINKHVNLLPENSSYKALTQPISTNLRNGNIGIAFARCYARMRSSPTLRRMTASVHAKRSVVCRYSFDS